jgi:arginyl-tRNA synthetase
MGKLTEKGWSWNQQSHSDTLDRLTSDDEKVLMNRLAGYPELIKNAAENLEPHTVANYLRELAGEFHSYYNSHKILLEDEPTRNARLALSQAVKNVIANGLALLGVSAPEAM